MVWCTAADVQALTGKVVGDEDVAQATGIIELTSGARVASFTTTSISNRNLDWLRRAVAYQAAWMVEHPDYFSRDDVSTFTQDGTSAAYRPDGLVLAPNARRCLKRLSWRGMRTVQAVPGRRTWSAAPYTSDDYDNNLPFQPL